MPTYEALRAYFDENEELHRVAASAAKIDIVQGFTLSVDPAWSVLYDIEDGVLDWPADVRHLGRFEGWFENWTSQYPYQSPVQFSLSRRFQGHSRRDLYRRVGHWDELREEFHHWARRDRLPVLMTIVHRPLRPPSEFEKEDQREGLRRLVSLVRETRVFVRIEERPPAQFALAPGDTIKSPRETGTLGGFLRDPTGDTFYGVTCAHVARKGDQITDVGGSPIGHCLADTKRVPLATGLVCDPVTLATPSPFPGNGPDVNTLDCALVQMNSPARAQVATGPVARTLTPGTSVVMRGAVTGTTRHLLGSLCMSYQVGSVNSAYCFRDTIELLPQPRIPLGGTLGALTAIVPTQGDSGSWVLLDNDPADWVGVFFAEDGHRGFCIRASWVHDWASGVVGQALTT